MDGVPDSAMLLCLVRVLGLPVRFLLDGVRGSTVLLRFPRAVGLPGRRSLKLGLSRPFARALGLPERFARVPLGLPERFDRILGLPERFTLALGLPERAWDAFFTSLSPLLFPRPLGLVFRVVLLVRFDRLLGLFILDIEVEAFSSPYAALVPLFRQLGLLATSRDEDATSSHDAVLFPLLDTSPGVLMLVRRSRRDLLLSRLSSPSSGLAVERLRRLGVLCSSVVEGVDRLCLRLSLGLRALGFTVEAIERLCLRLPLGLRALGFNTAELRVDFRVLGVFALCVADLARSLHSGLSAERSFFELGVRPR